MKCKFNVNSQWPAYLLYYNEVKKQDGVHRQWRENKIENE